MSRIGIGPLIRILRDVRAVGDVGTVYVGKDIEDEHNGSLPKPAIKGALGLSLILRNGTSCSWIANLSYLALP